MIIEDGDVPVLPLQFICIPQYRPQHVFLFEKHLRCNRRSRQNLSHATFLHPFSPATPKPCSMKLSSFPRTMISCGSDITELKSDALLYPGNLSAKTICTDDLLSSISCTLFFIVFYCVVINK